MTDFRFALEDDLSITDLRNVDEWSEKLAKSGKLRLQRSGKVLGVLVSAAAWNEFAERFRRFERAVEQFEDARDLETIVARQSDEPMLRGDELREALEHDLREAGPL